MVQGNIRRPLTRPSVILVLTAFVAVFSWPFVATAQTACDDRKAIVDKLAKTFSEAPVSMGLATNGSVIEVFASPTGTFTIILTMPSGLSCVMAAGENWEDLPERLNGAKIAAERITYLAPTGGSTWQPGIIVSFRGFCEELRDVFRLAQLYNADPTSRAAFTYFHAPDNSCESYGLPQVGVLRERVSASYVVNGRQRAAHIWRVETGDGEMVFVIVAEDPDYGHEA